MFANELPQLPDASGAMTGRFIVLQLTKSYYGHEDHGLTDRLLDEKSGILNWAIEGRRRLYERGYLVQPESSGDVIAELASLSSLFKAFLDEECVIGPGYSVRRDTLYEAWKQWCRKMGRDHAGTAESFGRDLRAALPAIKDSRPRVAGARPWVYEGVGLRRQSNRVRPNALPPEE